MPRPFASLSRVNINTSRIFGVNAMSSLHFLATRRLYSLAAFRTNLVDGINAHIPTPINAIRSDVSVTPAPADRAV
jgi:hypothetical protein